MLPDPLEVAARPSVIRVPGLGDAGVGLLKFMDEREDSHPIRHHHQCVSLGHSLLAEKEVNHSVTRTDHQRGPVAVAVEYKPHTTGSLKPHRPQHVCEVLLIE